MPNGSAKPQRRCPSSRSPRASAGGAGARAIAYLSRLDEAALLGRASVVRATNATVVLREPDGTEAEYVDLMSAYGCVNFGHRNPELRPFDDPPADIVACVYPPEGERLAAWLCNRLEVPDHRVLLQVGGSFAVSTAIALAQRARPGRVLAVAGAYHGVGLDSLTATTDRATALHDTPLRARLDGMVSHLDPGELPGDWSDVSSLIYEPVQGANGYVPLDPDWLRELERTARVHGVTTIADEIQCGFYRHGTLSVARRHGLMPDVLLYGKSFTNGLFPLSAVVFRKELERGFPGEVALIHTFQTSALGIYAALAVARFVDERAPAAVAVPVERHLRGVAERLGELEGVRRIHVTGPTLSFELTSGPGRELVRRALRERIIPFTGGPGGRRIRVAPPLTIPLPQLRDAMDTLVRVTAGMSGSGRRASEREGRVPAGGR